MTKKIRQNFGQKQSQQKKSQGKTPRHYKYKHTMLKRKFSHEKFVMR
jgi:hypothetical protein